MKHAILCLALLCLLGCATAPAVQPNTHVAVAPFIPPGADSYEVSPQQKVVLGEAIAQQDPVYPPALLAEAIPEQVVCLETEINEMGAIQASRPLYDIDGCPANATAVAPAFLAAAQSAVQHWRFEPAMLCTFPAPVDASLKGNDCLAEGAKVEALALKLAFRFTFSIQQGVASVRTDELDH